MSSCLAVFDYKNLDYRTPLCVLSLQGPVSLARQIFLPVTSFSLVLDPPLKETPMSFKACCLHTGENNKAFVWHCSEY
jgi:hypothetical protein